MPEKPFTLRRPERKTSAGSFEDRKNERTYWSNRFANDKVQPIKMAWSRKDTEYAVTTFRPLPTKYPDDPKHWNPWRWGNGKDGLALGDWMRRYEMWESNKHTAIVCPYRDPELERDKDPFCVFDKALYYAKDKGDGPAIIQKLMAGGQGRGALVSGRRTKYLLRAVLYERGMKDGEVCLYDPPIGLDPDSAPALLVLSNDLGDKIVDLCMRPVDADDEDLLEELEGLDEDTDPRKWEEYFEIGDPVDLKKGVFLRAFPEGGVDPRVGPKSAKERQRAAKYGLEKKKDAFKGYNVFYTREPFGQEGWTPDLSEYEADLRKKICPWDDALIVHSWEDRLRLAVDSLRWRDEDERGDGKLLADVVAYCLRDRDGWRQYLPDDLKDELAARVRVAAGHKRRDADDEDENGEAEEEETLDPRDRARGDRRRPAPAPEPEDGEEDEVEETPAPRRRRESGPPVAPVVTKARNGKAPWQEEPEDEDDDLEAGATELTPDADDDDDDEEEVEAVQAPAARRRRAAAPPPTEPEDDEAGDEDDGPAAEEAAPPRRARRAEPEADRPAKPAKVPMPQRRPAAAPAAAGKPAAAQSASERMMARVKARAAGGTRNAG